VAGPPLRQRTSIGIADIPPNPNGASSVVLRSEVEGMLLTGAVPCPAERTVLSTGLVPAGMRSLAARRRPLPTPRLAVRYQAPRASTFARGRAGQPYGGCRWR
jgi:hypothetical protein